MDTLGKCSYCGIDVSLPFTCKLCGGKFCGKHRLPENHECTNIGVYNTREYKIAKIAKSSYQTSTAEYMVETTPTSRGLFGSFWSTGNNTADVLLAGIIFGFVAFIQSGFIISGIPIFLLYGIVGLYTIYFSRSQLARKYHQTTSFILLPIGIAITLITAVFQFTLLIFGQFTIPESASLEEQSKIGIITIFTSVAMWLIGRYVLTPLVIIYNFANLTIPILITSTLFLWFALIILIPIRGWDGQRIYEWNTKYFWAILAIMLILIIINYKV